MVRRARSSDGVVRPTRPVRLFRALFTLGLGYRYRLEFTVEGVREVFCIRDRFTPWCKVRAAHLGSIQHIRPFSAVWFHLATNAADAFGHSHVPIAVNRERAYERIEPQFTRFAPHDVPFTMHPPRRLPSRGLPPPSLPEIERSLRTVRCAAGGSWGFRVRGRADGAAIVWCAEAHHAYDPTLNETGSDRDELKTAIEDAIEMARRLVS